MEIWLIGEGVSKMEGKSEDEVWEVIAEEPVIVAGRSRARSKGLGRIYGVLEYGGDRVGGC